jgi:DNA-binding protein YbaB
MTNFSDVLSQAKKMQEKMKETQENLKKIEVEGVSGGSAVTVILNGEYELKITVTAQTSRHPFYLYFF